MPIRIVHTADNHIGISYRSYRGDAEAQARLIAERSDALRRIVAEANERKAHFLVVAGDLFDRVTVPAREVQATVQVLREFSGEAVLVLPGNHDYYDGPAGKLWKAFLDAAAGSSIHLLNEQRVEEFDVEGQAVRFYPCPCPSKHGEEPLIGWVAGVPKDAAAIHVGVAHGNVEGLSLDSEGRYFTMRQEDLQAAGVTTWLLGHVHVPFPAAGSGGRPAFFMSGIHTPDSVKCRHPGHAWCIDLAADGVASFEQLAPGRVRFVRISTTLRSAADVESLRRQCEQLPADDTVLDLQIDGRLRPDDRSTFAALVERLRQTFLFVTCEDSVAHQLVRADLENLYPAGTLGHRLLARLIDDERHPDAAWLAHELLEAEKHG